MGDWQGQNDIDSMLRSIKIAKEIRSQIINNYHYYSNNYTKDYQDYDF